MGAVYEALDLRLSSTVALKQTLVSGEQLRRQFEREAQLLARLRHPGLPKVSDYFDSNGAQFLVMELIPGDDLGALLDANHTPFPIHTMLQWADQVLEILEYLHGQRPPVIHRDIKPQNLKLTPEGRIILLDFGLAKGTQATQLTGTSARSIVAYTPHYASHEQIYAAGTDERSDLYSLGATLYALCTGYLPASAVTRIAEAANNRPDPLIPPHKVNPQVPQAVSAVLMKALALSAESRYQSATAMREALHASGMARVVSPAPVAAPPANQVGPRPTEPAGTAQGARQGVSWLWFAIGGAALALLLAVSLGLALSSGAQPAPPTTAPLTVTAAPAVSVATEAAGATASPVPYPTSTTAPTAAPTDTPAAPTLAPVAEAPALCPPAQGGGSAATVSCYGSELAAALLENGYVDNVISLQGREALRASQSDPIDGLWSRDLDYAISGYSYVLADMAVMRNSAELLLAGVRDDGVAPEGIFKGQRDYVYGQTWDSMPNLIHAVYVYVAKTGERPFYEQHRETLLRIGNWIAGLDTDADGLPDRDVFPYGYYNSVENGPLHTYALARFYGAYIELAELEALVGQDGGAWRERAAQLRAGFHRPLEEGGYWRADQAWPIAWKRADGRVINVLETFGVFAALRSGLIAPTDARYDDLIAALTTSLPELLEGETPLRLTLGGYNADVKRAVTPPLPNWKLDASAPWIVGLAAPAYAAAGYPDDARAVIEAYERVAREGDLPRLSAGPDARYGAGSEGSGGAWDHAAWFTAVYGGHYGLTMTPQALVVRPRPFLTLEADGLGSFFYQGATVQLGLDRARQVYSLQADRPISVILRPMGGATLVRVNGGPVGAEEALTLEPGTLYVVESSDGS